MISMSDLLNFSKARIDEYETAKEPLTSTQQYYYDALKSARHVAVRRYIRNQNYFDNELLDICQQLGLERVFMQFSAMLIIAKCRMDQDFKIDLNEYIN